MSTSLLVAIATLIFTALGAVVAVIGVRQFQRPKPIQISGTVDPKPAFKLIGTSKQLSRTTSKQLSRTEAAALSVISKFVFVSHSGPTTTGSLGQFNFTLFLDLFSACTYPKYCKQIADLTVAHIKNTPLQERFTYIAVPKEGNVVLAAEIARRLRVGLIIVRAIVPPIRFGNPIEGMFPSQAAVAVVDDIACDGELLARTVATLRDRGGARVSYCFCAVERMDGNSRERLEEHHDVTLEAPIQLDEHTLRELAGLPNLRKPAENQRISPTEG
jgi:orotate phosphoribosyltransferase